MTIQQQAIAALKARDAGDPRWDALIAALVKRTGRSADTCEMLVTALSWGIPV